MDSASTNKMPVYRRVTWIAGAVLLLLYGGLFAAVWMSGLIPGRKGPLVPVATPTPVPTATGPRNLIYPPPRADMLRSDDLSTGLDGWSSLYGNGKMENIKEQLVLQTNRMMQPALAINSKLLDAGTKYYIQADLATDTLPAGGYGLVFGASDSLGTFYLFDCTPPLNKCRLLKITGSDTDTLIADIEAELERYPNPNTLSVYFDDGRMELYANGDLVSSYTDKQPFRYTGVGVLVWFPGFRVLADDFQGYSEK